MLEQETVQETQCRLLLRIAEHDREALAEFYDQTATPLYSLSMRILGDTQEAQEVIQDVFIQIWGKAGAFDAALGSAFHWALSITRNRSIDRLRSRRRRSRLIDELESESVEEPISQTDSPQFILSEDEMKEIRSAVEDLPCEQKEAIEMAFFGGLSHAEIAETLKEPLGTVKARIRRGMLKLRDRLKAYL